MKIVRTPVVKQGLLRGHGAFRRELIKRQGFPMLCPVVKRKLLLLGFGGKFFNRVKNKEVVIKFADGSINYYFSTLNIFPCPGMI